jgi:hypothetical protein
MKSKCTCRRSTSVLLAPWFVCLGLFVMAVPCEAQTHRYAVVIGANQGSVDDVPLEYATTDAERVAQALSELGRVPQENIALLLNRDAANVDRVLGEFNARIRASVGSDGSAMLFVFYSGHADSRSVHLGQSRLSFEKLVGRLEESPATMRILVIDACQSGSLTRVKGAVPAKSFSLTSDAQPLGKGIAIITSAAVGEDAQESERLQGSFFTHHFVSALRGAGDSTRDGRVTLAEAYRYAYDETLRSTSGAPLVQHPTYSFDIRGRKDVVLTHLDDVRRGLGRLVLKEPGRYMVFDGDEDGPLVSEVYARREGTPVVLAAGSYAIRRRDRNAIYDGVVRVRPGETKVLSVRQMRRATYGAVVRKGLNEDRARLSLGFTGGASMVGEVVPGFGDRMVYQAGLQGDFSAVTLRLLLRYSDSTASNTFVRIDQELLGLESAVFKFADFESVSLGLGLKLGVDQVAQTFQTEGAAPGRKAYVPHVGMAANAIFSPAAWLAFFVEASGDLYRLSLDDGEENRLSPAVSTGLVVYFL